VSVATDPGPDAVAAHVAALERALRGPARVRRSMIAEVRDGLEDAAACHRERGLDPPRAAAAAVRDFGQVGEVAPLLQEELTACQARATSALLAVAFPGLLVAWDLLWSSGVARSEAPPPPAVGVLARLMDAQSILVGLTAVVLLLATIRCSRPHRRIPALVGLTGILGMTGCTVTGVLMQLASTAASAAPAALVAYALTLAVLAAVTRSSVRTLQIALH
jgi:hypothetical protein